jgi:hypothetical protein
MRRLPLRRRARAVVAWRGVAMVMRMTAGAMMMLMIAQMHSRLPQ